MHDALSISKHKDMDKRESTRAPFKKVIKVVTNNVSFCGTAQNISVGGMFVKSYSLPPIGATIDLHFDILDENINVKAFVCWRSNLGFGVQFNLLGSREAYLIENYVNQQNSEGQ